MSITVNFMGVLADKAGQPKISIEKGGLKSSILNSILLAHPLLKDLSFAVSQNGIIVHGEANIIDGDEITLIPPAPGG